MLSQLDGIMTGAVQFRLLSELMCARVRYRLDYGRKRWKRHLRYVTASCPVRASVITLTQMAAFSTSFRSVNIYLHTSIASAKF